ncbi:hypothetical protein HK101_005369, partial [Irineochytrium annulatum]
MDLQQQLANAIAIRYGDGPGAGDFRHGVGLLVVEMDRLLDGGSAGLAPGVRIRMTFATARGGPWQLAGLVRAACTPLEADGIPRAAS